MEMAVRNGDLDVVRTLLDLGAELEGVASQPWSSLEFAVLNNDLAREYRHSRFIAALERAARTRQ